MKKFLPVILSIALLVMPGVEKMSAQTPNENRLQVFTNVGLMINISDNAKWGVARTDGETGFLINLETETVVELLCDQITYSQASDVSDDCVVVGSADNLPAYWTAAGEYHMLPLPPGDHGEGIAANITPDGKIICGTIEGGEFKGLTPLRWIRQDDGTYKVEKLAFPDKDLFGKQIDRGLTADRISPDGTMIAGRLFDYKGATFLVLWKNIEETPQPVIVGGHFYMTEDGHWNGWSSYDMPFTMDNKYLVGHIIEYVEDTPYLLSPMYSFVYDVKADEATVTKCTGDLPGLLLTDGRIISSSMQQYVQRNAFIDFPGQEGEGQKLEDYVLEHFGFNMLDQLDGSGTLMATSADEKSFVGFAGYAQSATASFCLKIANDLTGVAVEEVEKPVVYTQADGSIAVSGTKGAKVTLSDMSGRVIDTIRGGDTQVVFPGVKGQVYLVKVAFDKVSYLTKVIVK